MLHNYVDLLGYILRKLPKSQRKEELINNGE